MTLGDLLILALLAIGAKTIIDCVINAVKNRRA